MFDDGGSEADAGHDGWAAPTDPAAGATASASEASASATARSDEQGRERVAWVPAAGPDLDDDPAARRVQLHADLDALLDAERTDPGSALAGTLVGWDRLRRAVDGGLVATVAGFSASGACSLDAYRSPTAWLVGTVGLKRAAAGSLRRVCVEVAEHPTLAAAAASGHLSLDHLRALLGARTEPLVDAFDRDAAALVAAAGELTVDALARHLERWRLDQLAERGENDPDGPEPADPDGSTCRVLELLWGRAKVELDLDPLAAAEFKAGLEREHERLRRAGALDADPRTLAEVYGDIVMEVWRRGLPRSGPSSIVPLVNATVDLDTLLRRGGVVEPGERTRRIAEIAGHGPVADEVIAELLSRADLALLLTDAAGATLWYGRSRRLATPAQRAAVVAAGPGHCCFPGCTIAAERCEIDHLEGWARGGETDIDNLCLLCPFHNRLKHRWNLRVTRSADGTLAWHHPDGAEIRSRYRTASGPPPPGTTAPIPRRDDADPSGGSGRPDGSTPTDRGP